jgi:hypothetical protein
MGSTLPSMQVGGIDQQGAASLRLEHYFHCSKKPLA